MTGAEIKQFFENLIDDNLEENFAYDLMNNAKDEIESDRDWEILKKLDSSNSTTVGGTYSTEYSLSSDFFTVNKIFIDELEYKPVMFEEQLTYKDSSHRYFIDHRQSKLHLCGKVNTSKTIYIFYIYNTDEISATTSPVWPAKFHKLIAFKMAELYLGGIDSDEYNQMITPQQRKQAEMIYQGMVSWDTQLKLNAMDYSTKRGELRGDKQGFISDESII